MLDITFNGSGGGTKSEELRGRANSEGVKGRGQQ